MATFSSLEEAREHFKKDQFASFSGMVLDELGEDYSVCSVQLGEVVTDDTGRDIAQFVGLGFKL